MIQFPRRLIFALSLSAVAGCSSINPAGVPELDARVLPSLKLKGFHSVDLIVLNARSANEAKGNSQEVVENLRAALLSSLNRGGVKVDKDSDNKLRFVIEDCAAESTPDCVAVSAMLRTEDLNVEVDGDSTIKPARSPASSKSKKPEPKLSGMSKNYYQSFKTVIEAMPKRLKRALGR